jgi:putative DNA primase/helicase
MAGSGAAISMRSSRIPDLTRVNGFSYDDGELILSPNSPLDSARRLLSDRYTIDATQLLFHHRGSFYGWTGTHYKEVTPQYLTSDIYHFLEYARRQSKSPDGEFELKWFNPKKTHVNEVQSALAAASYLNDDLDSPSWLTEVSDLNPTQIIACTNGLLHLPDRTLLPHTPHYYTHNAIDYAYERKASEPTEWLNFLAQLWPDDPAAISTLQEMFGYCLVPDTSQQKAFLIVGPKRSGKGTIARVLSAVIGDYNVVSTTLSGLAGAFGAQPLIGKRLAIISDARISNKIDSAVIAERILSISGEDRQTIDRKNTTSWHGHLAIRFLILSNELPRIADASGALASRFIVLTMTRSFFGHEDMGLTSRLMRERPAILNWAIEGHQRLMMRGHFLQPDSAMEAIRDLGDLGSPISAFIRDMCVVSPGRMVEISRLFEAWKTWCREQNRDGVGTKQTFGRDIRSVVPGAVVDQIMVEGHRDRYYVGIALS